MMAYNILQEKMPEYMQQLGIDPQEVSAFDRLLKQKIYELPEDQIESTGYVLHTLEASLWCLLKTDTYKEAVLKAVNLGHDTDTTAAETGGLAGLYYGFKNIPQDWISQLARNKEIDDLAKRIKKKI
jgi:ADP-ribosylglycohydrolase